MMQGGFFVHGIFQLQHHQRHAVDEQHDVRPFGDVALGHAELVDGPKFVVFRPVKVQQPHQVAALRTILQTADLDPFDKHLMEGLIGTDQLRRVCPPYHAQGLFPQCRHQTGVEARHGLFQHRFQQRLGQRSAQFPRPARPDVLTVRICVAQLPQALQRQLLDVRFLHLCHDCCPYRERGEGAKPLLTGATKAGSPPRAPPLPQNALFVHPYSHLTAHQFG